ncbi:uncharacterized protein LOC121049260 [Rosa chinensis]|uniref:uncharacterized protein LOC121049260 n=1 Tax=Rosa chinensis TaxID=74649 RepID=UPI001AD94730|nr:uncharacterized protein LOC121049260 [Rosa chinensis]
MKMLPGILAAIIQCFDWKVVGTHCKKMHNENNVLEMDEKPAFTTLRKYDLAFLSLSLKLEPQFEESNPSTHSISFHIKAIRFTSVDQLLQYCCLFGSLQTEIDKAIIAEDPILKCITLWRNLRGKMLLIKE